MLNLHLNFDYSTHSQKWGGDFAKFLWLSQNIWTLGIQTYLYFFYALLNSFGTKENTFLDCAGLKGLNNTDPDTDSLRPSAQVYLNF